MTRIAADSTILAAIPAGVDVAFTYVNGSLGVSVPADVTKIIGAGKPVLGIDVNGSAPSAAVRDWEPGDEGGSLEQWVIDHNQLSGKKDACVYCDRANVAQVRQLTGSQVLGVDYFLWVSTLDGTMVTGPGIVACQVVTVGGYDLSVIYDDTWHPSAPAVAGIAADILQGLAAASAMIDQAATNTRRLTS